MSMTYVAALPGRSPPRKKKRCAPNGKNDSCGRRKTALFRPDASIQPLARRWRQRSSTVLCSRWGIRSSNSSMAAPAFTARWPKRPKPCGAAAVSAMIFLQSARKARRSKAHNRAHPGRCPTCACSIVPAKPSNPPARGAARRWAFCAAIIRTLRFSSTPRIKAT